MATVGGVSGMDFLTGSRSPGLGPFVTFKMNTETIKANYVASFEEVQKPGDFAWSSDFKMMFMLLPGVSLPPAGIRIVRQNEDVNTERPRWIWDGDAKSPTLTPSIHLPGVWHGYLTKGVFVSC